MDDNLGRAMNAAHLWLLKAISDLENAQYRHGTALAVDAPLAIQNLEAAFENARQAIEAFEDIPQLQALVA